MPSADGAAGLFFCGCRPPGPSAKWSSRTWPREVYWDRLAAHSRALAIHFEDYPHLAGFQCPDGSHLGG